MSVFYDNFVKLCAVNNMSESGAAQAIGLSNAAANGWKNGKTPSGTTRVKLANLFNVSVSELMGETDEKGIKKGLIPEDEADDRMNQDYLKLNAANRAAIDAAIAAFLASQQSED